MRQTLRHAMREPDHFVVGLDYTDAKGRQTHRIISPIRFLSPDRFLGLCLSREEPRQFYLDRCENLQILPSVDVLMPVPL